MKRLLYFVVIAVIFAAFASCGVKTKVASFQNHETECVNVELDGSQTLKAWGTGRYWYDATEQAKKNAVRDVLFKGHFAGNGGCLDQPLIMEVNAQEKYADYFNKFFRDGGEYKTFISLKDERIGKHIIRQRDAMNKDQSLYSVIVRVKRVELKEQLIKDGILKP
jgi:hypothetical protein